MKRINFGRVFIITVITSLLVSILIYSIDKNLIPPQEKIEDLVKYADNITYLRMGAAKETQLKDNVKDIKVITELDEQAKDKSELLFYVTLKDKDYMGVVHVTYPAKRDTLGNLIIGTTFHKTQVYVHTPGEYVEIFFFITLTILIFMLAIATFMAESDKKNKT